MSFPVKYSVDWQCTCLLLYALRPLSSGATKEIVLSKIEDEKWLSLQQEDYDPYPSAWYHNLPEPRWMTLIAYARDHGKGFGFIANDERNCWKITDSGIEQVERLCRKASEHELDVTRCFLWSPKFKLLLDPTFSEDQKQAKRPTYIYRDKNPWKDLL